jgi:hypothetical protein
MRMRAFPKCFGSTQIKECLGMHPREARAVSQGVWGAREHSRSRTEDH